MTAKNITRYTYKIASFLGWRLSISRKSKQFTKYFSDSKYGSEDKAFQVALDIRDRILQDLASGGKSPQIVFEKYKQMLREEDIEPLKGQAEV